MDYAIKTNDKTLCPVLIAEVIKALRRCRDGLLSPYQARVVVKLNRLSVEGEIKGSCSKAGEDFLIDLNIFDPLKSGHLEAFRKLAPRRRFIEDVIKTLIHELKHVEQIASGNLLLKDVPIWKGVEKGEEPWEVDADKFMNENFNEYLDLSHIDSELLALDLKLPPNTAIELSIGKLTPTQQVDFKPLATAALARHAGLIMELGEITLKIEARVPPPGVYPLVSRTDGGFDIYIPIDPMYVNLNIHRRLITGLINGGLREVLLESSLSDDDKKRLSIDHLPTLVIDAR